MTLLHDAASPLVAKLDASHQDWLSARRRQSSLPKRVKTLEELMEEVLRRLDALEASPPSSDSLGEGVSVRTPPAEALDTLAPESPELAEEVPDLSQKMIPAEIASLMEEGESVAKAKQRLTQLLWIEEAELKQAQGRKDENLKRGAEIEYLLGLLARLGDS